MMFFKHGCCLECVDCCDGGLLGFVQYVSAGAGETLWDVYGQYDVPLVFLKMKTMRKQVNKWLYFGIFISVALHSMTMSFNAGQERVFGCLWIG